MRLKIILVGVSLASVPAASMAQDQLQYRYDAQGRLIRTTRAPAGSGFGNITTYTYDDADNRRQRAVTFGSLAALTLEPLGLPQIRLAEVPDRETSDQSPAIAVRASAPTIIPRR